MLPGIYNVMIKKKDVCCVRGMLGIRKVKHDGIVLEEERRKEGGGHRCEIKLNVLSAIMNVRSLAKPCLASTARCTGTPAHDLTG